MISVIIPSRNEQFLIKTVEDLLAKAEGEIEIIPVLDGYWPNPSLPEDERITIIHRGTARGLRNAVNSAAGIAKGEFIMKTDAHCMFDQGFDVKLAKDCKEDYICIPTRHRLDAEKWEINNNGRPPINHMLLSFPDNEKDWGGKGLNGKLWNEKNREEQREKIHDLMTFQGSCWFMKKDYFWELGGLDEENYGTFFKEPQELTFKCWLSGGRLIRNQNTWYAHLHKGKKYGRGYYLASKEINKSAEFNNKWLTNDVPYKTTRKFEWLIEHFWPVPGWPEDRNKWKVE
jgi:glycosyltransferase involved in cell wall biosynthesis